MLRANAPAPPQLAEWYARNRARSRALFDLLDPDAYYTRPISLRNPIVFYEGHLPAFSSIAFLERGLGGKGVDARLEALFARGIDPESEEAAVPRSGASTRWPSREEVLEFGCKVDAAMIAAIEHTPMNRPATPQGHQEVEGLFTALEHEAMHQETLLYMWRRLPHDRKHKPPETAYELDGPVPRRDAVRIPAGTVRLGADRDAVIFGWDNEFDAHEVHVPAFEVDVHCVTNADYLEFIADGGYDRGDLWSDVGWEWRIRENVRHPAFWIEREGRWYWRGMFEELALPASWPVYVSQVEAHAYACWKGRRLMQEPEFHRAAYGGQSGAVSACTPVNIDFAQWEPVPAGSRRSASSGFGVADLVGNGWEWTSTVFAPFPGFQPMRSYPEYSAEFFDGQHVVLKGGSPGTARELVRPSFRNWFRPNYPFVYAKFRTAVSI